MLRYSPTGSKDYPIANLSFESLVINCKTIIAKVTKPSLQLFKSF